MNNLKIDGIVEIEVRYTIKKVRTKSLDVAGLINNKSNPSKFEVSVPIKSFQSNDPVFDEHLQEACQIGLYPSAIGRGSIDQNIFKQKDFSIPVQIEFHGVTREYMMNFKEYGKVALFNLHLDSHHLKRPSLLGIKINNEVKIQFQLSWPIKI